MLVSVVITAYNEGDEVSRTIESVRQTTRCPFEIILVDDASTDGCCAALDCPDVRIVQHSERLGIGPSRNEGAGLARGDAVAFLDAHQRLSSGCLDRCAELAMARAAVVWPDVSDFDECYTHHGATFRLGPRRSSNGACGPVEFTARWNRRRPIGTVSRISALRAPGYVMPRRTFDRVRLPSALRGWGASEAAIGLKAFFLDVPILHLCGPLARHLFKKKFHYPVKSGSVVWNHAVLGRVLFEERTWFEYWLPRVFAHQLPDSTLKELDAPAVCEEQQEFRRCKVRCDRDFWRWLLKQPEPQCLKRRARGAGLAEPIATYNGSQPPRT